MKLLRQIGLVLGICFVGEGISLLLPFSFPGSVVAMILLFLLLRSGKLKPQHIREKSNFLLSNMAFFFIPAGVRILGDFAQIRESLIPLLLICVITTVLTFAAAAFAVKGVLAIQKKAAKKND